MKWMKTENGKYIHVFIDTGSGDSYFVLSTNKLTSKFITQVEKARKQENGKSNLNELINAHLEWGLEVIDFDDYSGIYGVE